ncbi:MAG: hypothetical protein ACM34K_01390 [Bacillota bacterium]
MPTAQMTQMIPDNENSLSNAPKDKDVDSYHLFKQIFKIVFPTESPIADLLHFI